MIVGLVWLLKYMSSHMDPKGSIKYQGSGSGLFWVGFRHSCPVLFYYKARRCLNVYRLVLSKVITSPTVDFYIGDTGFRKNTAGSPLKNTFR